MWGYDDLITPREMLIKSGSIAGRGVFLMMLAHAGHQELTRMPKSLPDEAASELLRRQRKDAMQSSTVATGRDNQRRNGDRGNDRVAIAPRRKFSFPIRKLEGIRRFVDDAVSLVPQSETRFSACGQN